MARQGLPATLSKESMQNVNYLQREIRENPKMLGLIEKDVNNAIESIDKHLKARDCQVRRYPQGTHSKGSYCQSKAIQDF